MILQVPPAAMESAPLPSNVHLDLRSTRKGAEKSGRQQVVCILPEDETRFQAALAYLRTLEGTWLRSIAEVWLAKPGQPEIQSLMDKAELRSLPAIVQMDAKAQAVLDYMAGTEVAPLDQACRILLQRENAFDLLPSAKIKEWSGGMDPEPFVAFGKARATDLGAAAKPLFCRWLVDLVRGTDPNLQLWAATRLLEANASLQSGDPDVWGVLLRDCEQQFRNTIQGKKPEQRSIPWRRLGLPGIVDLRAPFWSAFRALLRSPKAPRIGSTIYALMAPVLLAEDRDWVIKAFSSAEASLNGEPWNNTAFWVGADWLLAYGKPADWAEFQRAQLDKSWRNALHETPRAKLVETGDTSESYVGAGKEK
jgi:hypothetical protein